MRAGDGLPAGGEEPGMHEKIDRFACGKCGNETLGRFTLAFLEKSGWRKVGGVWVCDMCNGLFAEKLKDKPHVQEWLEERRREMEEGEEP